MSEKSIAAGTVLLVGILVLAGCKTTPVTVTASTTPLHDKTIAVNHGAVKGSHRAWSVFGLWMIGRPDTDKAIRKALEVHGADALINVTCYERVAWYFFVSSHDVVVEGEAVVFGTNPPAERTMTPDGKDGVRSGRDGKNRQQKR